MPRNNTPSLNFTQQHRDLINNCSLNSAEDHMLNKYIVVLRNGQLMTDYKRRVVVVNNRAKAITTIRENLECVPVFEGTTINPYAAHATNSVRITACMSVVMNESNTVTHEYVVSGRATGISIRLGDTRMSIPFVIPLEFPVLLDETEPPWRTHQNRDPAYNAQLSTARNNRLTNRARIKRFKTTCNNAVNAIITELETMNLLRIVQYRDYLQQTNITNQT